LALAGCFARGLGKRCRFGQFVSLWWPGSSRLLASWVNIFHLDILIHLATESETGWPLAGQMAPHSHFPPQL